MNPILTLARNNIHLTKKAIASFVKQDIDTTILLIDNASTDGTGHWASTLRDIYYTYNDPPKSVAASWNQGLKWLFKAGAQHVLVCNNDVELRPETYRYLLEERSDFVTAVGTRELSKMSDIAEYPLSKRPHPDFSCFLITRTLYEKVGDFDEAFKIAFCEDGDYDIRMHKAGYSPYCIDLPFLHHGSMTIKNSDPAEIRKIQIQADKNRAYFKLKWGFAMASPEYYDAMGKGGPPTEQ